MSADIQPDRATEIATELRRTYDFGNRRTVNGSLLRDATRAIEQLGREHEAALKTRDLANQQKLDLHDRVLTRTHALEVERLQMQLDSARRAGEHQEDTIRTLTERLSNVKQTSSATDDGIEVSFAAPTSEYGRPRDWTVGELEDICYRLRAAGADDITKVDVAHKHTTAIVAFPELALEGLQRRTETESATSAKKPPIRLSSPAAAASVLALVVMVLILGVVIL